MINVGDLLSDPDLVSMFTILRDPGSNASGGYFGRGGFISVPTVGGGLVPITATGVITPADPQEIQMLPEGDRVSGVFKVTTGTQLMESIEGPPASEADIVLWQGQQYKVMKLLAYGQYGYWRALVTQTTTS